MKERCENALFINEFYSNVSSYQTGHPDSLLKQPESTIADAKLRSQPVSPYLPFLPLKRGCRGSCATQGDCGKIGLNDSKLHIHEFI